MREFDAGASDLGAVDHRGNTGLGIGLTRLSPASPAGTSLDMPPMTDATPLRDVADVGGVWLMHGSGMLLAIETGNPDHATTGSMTKAPSRAIPSTMAPWHWMGGEASPCPATPDESRRVRRPERSGVTMKDVVVTDRGFEAQQGVDRHASTQTSPPSGSG